MTLLGLQLWEISVLFLAAAGIGVSKSGFAGVSLIHVLLFAMVFGAKQSTGVLLPMLVVGDLMAIYFFGRKVEWKQVLRLLPPAMVGVMVGALVMDRLDETIFKPTVGTIILALTVIQVLRIWRPQLWEKVPHSLGFAWTLGFLVGMTTMLANAAGPIVALYMLAVSLPKLELVACSAWFFLVINLFKMPFSYGLGLIHAKSLVLDLILSPGILLGMLFGRWLIERVPQRTFDGLLLAFTAFVALRMVGLI